MTPCGHESQLGPLAGGRARGCERFGDSEIVVVHMRWLEGRCRDGVTLDTRILRLKMSPGDLHVR